MPSKFPCISLIMEKSVFHKLLSCLCNPLIISSGVKSLLNSFIKDFFLFDVINNLGNSI